MIICEKEIKIGDFVKVQYTKGKQFKGGTIKGKITKIWDGEKSKQAQVNHGWCFHDCDIILEHKVRKET